MKAVAAFLAVAAAAVALIGSPAHSASAQTSSTPIPALSATGCTDGTFVDLTANPMVAGANNDLVEDCQTLVAAQAHWAAVTANDSLASNHFLRSWGTGTATQKKVNNWAGVTVAGQRVSQLWLVSRTLNGTIPSQLSNLSALVQLRLAGNRLSGSIPTELGSLTNLTNLHLDLNSLSGNIPTQLSSLTNLSQLDLSNNTLSGNIPTQLGSLTNLTQLRLAGNRLSGSIPAELGNLTNLTNLHLDLNSLSGSIPTQLSSLTNLTQLDLSSNALSGNIPTQLGSLTRLTWVSLSNNKLSGSIPANLRHLTSLRTLNLSNNQLSGSIPSQFSSLTSLQSLNLSYNRLSGSIPSQLDSLADPSNGGVLTSLHICNNYLTGAVPQFLQGAIPFWDTTSYNPVGCQITSDIQFSAPAGLVVNTGRSIKIDASRYASDGEYIISCRNVTGRHALISSITLSGCTYTVTAGSTAGAATFTVPYSSTGGDTHNGQISITINSASGASRVTFTAPSPNPTVAAGRSITINAGAYASDGSYTISCGDATNRHARIASIARTPDTCTFSVTAGSAQGSATFSVRYTSAGGNALTATITVTIGPASDIAFNPPTDLSAPAGGSIVIDASAYASDGSYAIACGDIPNVPRNGCSYTFSSGRLTAGATGSLTVPYTSSGGDTFFGKFFISIGPSSRITYTPPSITAFTGGLITLDASNYAEDGNYTISCGDAKSVDMKISIVSSAGCQYYVSVGFVIGTASFTVPYESSGGDTHDGIISISISYPPLPSDILFSAPYGLEVGSNQTLTIDASDYASDAFGYTVSCNNAIGVDVKITVQRTGCSFTITPAGTQGLASFTVPYTSNGGDTHNGVITVEIGPASTIAFTAPTGLTLATNRTMTINAASYAEDGSYYITCGNAASVDSKITVTRPNANLRPCDYAVTPTGTTGTATFTVPYTSSGGHTANGTVSIEVAATSTIVFSAPNGLTTATGSTLTINAGGYATDGSYTISCGEAFGRDAKITRITNTGCSYEITTGETTGTATFTVPYSSSGGHTLNGQISVAITARARSVAPVFDRQQAICAMQGYEPVRHSTADRITQADPAAAFCRTPTGIVCSKRGGRAEVSTILINIRGLSNSLNSCYASIRGS